jgi:G3E family GTPase
MVVTQELRNVSAMALRDVSFDIGPVITLVDGPMFDSWWHERKQLLLGQIADADIVAVSRADLMEQKQLEKVQNTLKGHANGIITLSNNRGWGIDEVMAKIG